MGFHLIKNAVKCKVCGKTLESKYTHDFQSCEHIFTDGGLDYLRRGTYQEATLLDIIDLSEWQNDDTDEIIYTRHLPSSDDDEEELEQLSFF